MNPTAWMNRHDNHIVTFDRLLVKEAEYAGVDNWIPLYTAPRELSDEEIDLCAEETGMWCDGTPDSWDTEAIHNFARAILKKAREK